MTYNPLPIVLYPDPVLLTRCGPVAAITTEIETLAGRMVATVLAHPNCVGLAAPQVGVPVRMIVVRFASGRRNNNIGPCVMVNPVKVREGDDRVAESEGCLSQPGVTFRVIRRRIVDVSWQTIGETVECIGTFKGMDARVIQHELDHLDGINIGRSKP